MKRFFAVVPAAGVGARMQADRPKQYLMLGNRSVMAHTLQSLIDFTPIEKIVVAVSSDDAYWPEQGFVDHSKILTATGGKERCYSVLNALNELTSIASKDDWVMVHDVARPNIQHSDLDKLVAQVSTPDGLLLGYPVRDTMKRSKIDNTILHTVDRNLLWHALTPQVFPLGKLIDALTHCLENGLEVTDDASAMEQAGFSPTMIEGRSDNLKITRPEDLALADFYYQRLVSDQSQQKSSL